jgi:hypothetical protein
VLHHEFGNSYQVTGQSHAQWLAEVAAPLKEAVEIRSTTP